MYRVFFPLSFCPLTWFSMQNSKILSLLESSRNYLEFCNSSWNDLFFAKFNIWSDFPTRFLALSLIINLESKLPSFLESFKSYLKLLNFSGNGLLFAKLDKLDINSTSRGIPEFQIILGWFQGWCNFGILHLKSSSLTKIKWEKYPKPAKPSLIQGILGFLDVWIPGTEGFFTLICISLKYRSRAYRAPAFY